MKARKILIVMIFAALGFTAHAQKGGYTSNTSVKQYVYALNLSPSQVRDWTKLNRYYEDEFYYVSSNRKLSSRAQTKQLNNLYGQRDHDLRGILSNRQYRKFSNLASYNTYSRPATAYYGSRNSYRNTRSNSYRRTNSYNRSRSYGNSYSCRAY